MIVIRKTLDDEVVEIRTQFVDIYSQLPQSRDFVGISDCPDRSATPPVNAALRIVQAEILTRQV